MLIFSCVWLTTWAVRYYAQYMRMHYVLLCVKGKVSNAWSFATEWLVRGKKSKPEERGSLIDYPINKWCWMKPPITSRKRLQDCRPWSSWEAWTTITSPERQLHRPCPMHTYAQDHCSCGMQNDCIQWCLQCYYVSCIFSVNLYLKLGCIHPVSCDLSVAATH